MKTGKIISLLAAVLLVASPLTVLADQQLVDNDLGTSGNQNIVTLNCTPGAAVTTSGQIVINWSGGNHLDSGTEVTFKADAQQTHLPGDYSVSNVAVNVSNPWSTGGSVYGTSIVSFNAPTDQGSYSYTVKWTTEGEYGNKLTGAPALTINLVVSEPEPLTCDPPIITINTPGDGERYLLNQPVTADWAVEDGGCGIESEVGTVDSGSPIDTRSVGSKDFIVNASDYQGNDASQTNTYSVAYGFGGFLPPLGPGPKEFNAGSTIPVKFQLFDFGGNVVGSANGTASVANVSASIRYDASAGQYIVTLKTPRGVTGTFNIKVRLDDGTEPFTSVVLK